MPCTLARPALRKSPYDSDRPQIEELITQGMTDTQIANIYGVIRDTIHSRRKRWGLLSAIDLRDLTLKDDMTTLWQNGYTVQEMADCLKINLHVVYTKAREYNLRSKSRIAIDAQSLTITELNVAYANNAFNDEDTVVITYNRLPKWVLVPVEQYQDMASGLYQETNNES